MEQDTLYLFTGSEEPVIRTRINRLIDELSKTPSDVIKYDMDLTSFKKVISEAVTIPFLQEQKIIVAYKGNLNNIKEFFEPVDRL